MAGAYTPVGGAYCIVALGQAEPIQDVRQKEMTRGLSGYIKGCHSFLCKILKMPTHYRISEDGDLHLAGLGDHHPDYDADTEEDAVQKPKVRRRMRKPETWKRTTTSKDYNSGKRRR